MDNRVAQAALALVHPSSTPAQRSEASNFLEQWTVTPEAWTTFGYWLRSILSASNIDGTHLLCLTMLLSKIRKQVPFGSSTGTPPISSIRDELWNLFQQPHLHITLIRPLCSCLAAVAVRGNDLQQLLLVPSGSSFLMLLSCIPAEMEACTNFSDAAQVTQQLRPHLPNVLQIIQGALLSIPCLTLVLIHTLSPKNLNMILQV